MPEINKPKEGQQEKKPKEGSTITKPERPNSVLYTRGDYKDSDSKGSNKK